MNDKDTKENQQATPLTTQETKTKAKVYTSITGGPVSAMQYVTQKPEDLRVNKDGEIMKYSQFGTEFAMDARPLIEEGRAYTLDIYKDYSRKLFNIFIADFVKSNDLKTVTVDNVKDVIVDVETFKKAIGNININNKKANELLAEAGKQLLMARFMKNINNISYSDDIDDDNIAISFVRRSRSSKHNTLILTPSADLVVIANQLRLTQSALNSLGISGKDYIISNIAKQIEDCINAQPDKDPLPIRIETLIPCLDMKNLTGGKNWRRDIQLRLERSLNALAGIGDYDTDFLKYWHYAVKEDGEFRILDNIAFTDPNTNNIKAINEYNKEVRKMFRNYDQFKKGYIIARSVIHDSDKFIEIKDQKKRTADLKKAKKINRENRIIEKSKGII